MGDAKKPEIVTRLNRAFYEFQDKVRGAATPKFLFLGGEERDEFSKMVVESTGSRIFRVPAEAHDNRFRGCEIVSVMKKSLIAFGL